MRAKNLAVVEQQPTHDPDSLNDNQKDRLPRALWLAEI